MSQTYSTVTRDMAAGRVYSTLRQLPSASPVPERPAPARPAGPSAPLRRFAFSLSPVGAHAVPGMLSGASGRVVLEGRPGEAYRVTARLTGVPPAPDPAVGPVLWLIHDLTVPAELAPEDMALLPRGPSGSGNLPGSLFTLDGNPATYGNGGNTLTVAVSPGRFTPGEPDTWHLAAVLDQGNNQGFHPLYFAGPAALADINTPVPSGTLARILTDLFMRPATVHPELPVRSHYLPRLQAVVSRHLGPNHQPSQLDGSAFTRAAVTLEGPVRPTPTLMPTREACILQGPRDES